MNAVHDTAKNLAKYASFIDEAAAQRARLLVLPEQSLQGYLYHLNHELSPDEANYLYDTAEPIPGPSTERVAKLARKAKMHVIFGMTERVGVSSSGILYNSAVLVGPRGVDRRLSQGARARRRVPRLPAGPRLAGVRHRRSVASASTSATTCASRRRRERWRSRARRSSSCRRPGPSRTASCTTSSTGRAPPRTSAGSCRRTRSAPATRAGSPSTATAASSGRSATCWRTAATRRDS